LGNASTRGFGRDDHAGGVVQSRPEGSEFGGGELVKDQVAYHDRVVRKTIKRPQVGSMPRLHRLQSVWTGPKIESVGVHAVLSEVSEQFARAGAELERSFAGMHQRRRNTREPSVATEDAIGQTQISPTMQCSGVICRKRIEKLGLKHAVHRES